MHQQGSEVYVMDNKKSGRWLCGLAAIAVIALAGVAVAFYGAEGANTDAVLPGKQAEVEAVLLAKEPDVQPVERVMAPDTVPVEVSAPVITADMEMPLLTESGLYPEQEAAQEITVYDLTHEPEEVIEEPVWQQSPASEYVPAQPQPAPAPEYVPVPEPVYTDNQQEGCVGDGLTW